MRLGTYAEGRPPPPAAVVGLRRLERDPRAEPLFGERVRRALDERLGRDLRGLTDAEWLERSAATPGVSKATHDELARLFSGHSGGKRTRLALVRHTRTSNSEAHQWLRKLIVKLMSEQEAAED